MTSSKKHSATADTAAVTPLRSASAPQSQFIRLRPLLHERELLVLNAVAALPADCRTPSAVASELVRRGIGIPYSTIGAILRRLERKGALTLKRVKP